MNLKMKLYRCHKCETPLYRTANKLFQFLTFRRGKKTGALLQVEHTAGGRVATICQSCDAALIRTTVAKPLTYVVASKDE